MTNYIVECHRAVRITNYEGEEIYNRDAIPATTELESLDPGNSDVDSHEVDDGDDAAENKKEDSSQGDHGTMQNWED
jgi:hypothetical protein